MVDSCPSPLPSGKEYKAAAEESMPPPLTKNDVLQEVSKAATGIEDPSRPSTSRRQVLKGVLQQCTIDIIDPDSIQVSLESFPYYVNETTKNTMISSMFVPLKCRNKYPTDLPTVSPLIRLLGPRGSNLYQETLAKALAKFFGAKFLLVDWLMLPEVFDPLKERWLTSLKGTDQPAEEGSEKIAPEGKDDGVKVKVNIKVVSETEPEGDPEGKNDDVNVVCELFEVALKESERGPLVIFLREGAKYMTDESSEAFKIQLERLPKNVVVILSFFPTGILKKTIPQPCTHDHILKKLVSLIEEKRSKDVTSSKDAKTAKTANRTVREPIWKAFSTEVTVEIPRDEAQLSEWNQMLNHDVETLRSQKNVLCISEALDRNGIQCCDLDELCIKSEVQLTSDEADKIIPWALSHHFMHSSEACGKGSDDQKLSISRKSIEYGIELVIRTLNVTSKKTSSEKSVKDIVPENDFERKLLPEIIPPSEIGVSFEDIGALENVKDTLKELVMLPLQRPELFSRGQLTKPCKGILLFGPPGSGKTMLAKAVATEAGANFINISVSTVTSVWVGQGEKYMKAVFTLASKIAPSVVFVDEIDSMLGQRTDSERDWMRRMKNEFMVHWDGLRTKQKERVLVLGATNRPFDLDEAVLRRLPRRLMVNLPDAINREKILKVMLLEEELNPNVKLNVIANMTEGFSGSDLKNLCVTAAHCPIRELLEKEKREKALALSENRPLPPLYTGSDVRPLSMEDFDHASRQVGASLSSESQNMAELLEWNEIYGEGGSRNTKSLSYYI